LYCAANNTYAKITLPNKLTFPRFPDCLAPPIYATGKRSQPVPTGCGSASLLSWRRRPLHPRLPARNRIKGRAHCQSLSQFPYCARREETEFWVIQQNRKHFPGADFRLGSRHRRPSNTRLDARHRCPTATPDIACRQTASRFPTSGLYRLY